MIQPPILWVRFFGWFGSGVGLGWLMRDLTTSATAGAMSWAIKLVIISAIAVPFAVIYLLLRLLSDKNKCNT